MRRWNKQDHEAKLAASERVYSRMQSIRTFMEAEDDAQTKADLRKLRQEGMEDVMGHFFASSVWLHLGDETEAFAENSLAIAADPDSSLPYLRCAKLFMRRGDREAAEQMIEKAWERAKREYPKREHEEQKAKYYSILDRVPKTE